MKYRMFVILFSLAAGVVWGPAADAAPLAPTDDSFGYQFLSGMNLNSPPFGSFLPSGRTTTGHDTKSVLKFDLSSVTLTAEEVTSATLDLYVVPTEATGFGVSPSPTSPITVNLFALAPGAWDEGTVTWNSIPAAAGQFDSHTISGTSQTVSFDVTALVQQWLSGDLANGGLLLEADQPVGSSPNWVYAVFSSSEGQVSPELNIVPEPGGMALALVALPALAWTCGRRGWGGRRLK